MASGRISSAPQLHTALRRAACASLLSLLFGLPTAASLSGQSGDKSAGQEPSAGKAGAEDAKPKPGEASSPTPGEGTDEDARVENKSADSTAAAESSPTVGAAAFSGASDLERPIENPETRALLVRAEEHYYRKRHHIALKLFQLVIEREPEHALAYRYAGDIYLKRGDLDLAEEHLQIARELSAHPEQEWFRLGQVAYLRSDADAARLAFERALEMKPDFVICRFYLGFVSYRLQRDKERTIEHWESYRRLAPADPQGPAIDRAIEILRDPDYEIPKFDAGDEPRLPESADGADTRVPYQPGRDENEKSENTGEELINIDDL
ncbi:MAG: tetratricopeptide repeat protein [Leptospirales bacterium]